ncbi:Hypothetical protein NTJ_01619 [Nesidiocoris tenuis]|uniref:Uncharacterized protein n=1 Tax=Nesidiocoris tenuis TaxID=355587 RepID=A0ABN7A920_9HEMI|nr:Hypothetical protein NTJ_01619 [Nesidiocoris tenuis]
MRNPEEEEDWRIENGDVVGNSISMDQSSVFQQSVTLTAKMWPNDNNGTSNTASSNSWPWRMPTEQLPLIIAIFTGGALIILLVIAAVLWRFCVAPHRNKDYRVKIENAPSPTRPVVPVLPSESAVYLDPKSGQWSVSSRVLEVLPGGGSYNAGVSGSHWFYNNRLLDPAALDRCPVLPRSITVPTHHKGVEQRPPRPHSQPSSLSPDLRTSRVVSRSPAVDEPCSLPQISEFSPPQFSMAASTTILEESSTGSKEVYLSPFNGGLMMKTQSLPACVRNKTRPLSTADDVSELYAKVNFSKKRKNRMRNDEAAIIALSKSRSQFLHKDTDSLVDNEAVVVYDERTAL